MSTDRPTIPDASLEIIRSTNDGDDLSPKHLKLVELAVNGRLNDQGITAFYALLEQVRTGYSADEGDSQ